MIYSRFAVRPGAPSIALRCIEATRTDRDAKSSPTTTSDAKSSPTTKCRRVYGLLPVCKRLMFLALGTSAHVYPACVDACFVARWPSWAIRASSPDRTFELVRLSAYARF